MNQYVSIPIGDFFTPVGGSAKYIRTFIDANPGIHPVYSASLRCPFGYVDHYCFDGRFLSWTMNGYGGHVSEINGKFSLTRDRGVFKPRTGVKIPDLTYLRFAMEPVLKAAAIGRRVDGKLNTYTKIYPDTAAQQQILLPVNASGELDFALMEKLGERYRKMESALTEIQTVLDALRRSSLGFGVAGAELKTLALGAEWMEFVSKKTGWTKAEYLKLDTGNIGDAPVYTAARGPVAFVSPVHEGLIEATPEEPVISFAANGDGSAGTNFVFHEVPFYVSNDRTCIRVLDENIDPWYVFFALDGIKIRFGFGHAYKATPRNLSEVTIGVPLKNGELDRETQVLEVKRFRVALKAKQKLQEELETVSSASIASAAEI